MAGLTDRALAAIASGTALDLAGLPADELFFDAPVTIPPDKKLYIKGMGRAVEIRIGEDEVIINNYGQLDLRKVVLKAALPTKNYKIRTTASGGATPGCTAKDCILTGCNWVFDGPFTATLAVVP